MDFRHEFSGPADVVGLLRAKFQSEDFGMSIEHKLEPIEHWIVYGKAYRLATEADVGKECYRSDTDIELAMKNSICVLSQVRIGEEYPYLFGTKWKYAYVQDDSLLAPQRTPVPALGDGWFLLKDNEVLRYNDKVTVYEDLSLGWVDAEGLEGHSVAFWQERTPGNRAARYFGPSKEPQPATESEQQPKPIDWTKPVRTKDGRAVRVLCTDGPGDYPVVGFINGVDGPECWRADGSYFESFGDDRDLESAPQRIQLEYWVNVYEDGEICEWEDKDKADKWASSTKKRFACVKITIDCEEGEGL